METAVWYVQGEGGCWPTLFATKALAEAYARELFPDETADQRYARVMFRRVVRN